MRIAKEDIVYRAGCKIPGDKDPFEATVVRTRLGFYDVHITHGVMQFGPEGGPFVVWGRKRAERKAIKELYDYVLREEKDAELWKSIFDE